MTEEDVNNTMEAALELLDAHMLKMVDAYGEQLLSAGSLPDDVLRKCSDYAVRLFGDRCHVMPELRESVVKYLDHKERGRWLH